MVRIARLVLVVIAGLACFGGAGAAQSNANWTVVDLAGSPGSPVATNGGVELLYLYALVTPGWVYIRGELLNTTDQTIAVPTVTVTLLDDAGTAIEERKLIGPFSPSPAPIYRIDPGERFGVSGSTQRPKDEWPGVTAAIGDVTPIEQAVIDAQSTGLEAFNLNEQQKSGMSLDLLGEVRNTSTKTATDIEVRLTFYLGDGRYVGGASTDLDPPVLAPGETGSFAHYQAPFVVGTDWTYTVEVVGLASSETPPDTGQGIVEIGADATYEGEPRAARTGVELTYLYASDSSSSGWLTFYGELTNTTDQPLATPTFAVTFYDGEGRVANSRSSQGVFAVIPPGESVPVEVYTNLVVGSWQRAVVKLGPSEAPDPDRTFERLVVENVVAEGSPDHLRLTGEVVNDGEHIVSRIAIKVLFYDAQGRYAGHDLAFPDGMADLEPGGRVPFTFDEDVDADPGWTYRLAAEGRAGS